MRRLAALLIALSVAGCSAQQLERAERGWTVAWAVLQTPVHAVCTPWNALWDLAILGPDEFARYGLTASMWRAWLAGVSGEESDWAVPVAMPLLPVLTAVQPLPLVLHILGSQHPG